MYGLRFRSPSSDTPSRVEGKKHVEVIDETPIESGDITLIA
jgi:hypothetical protein